MAHSGSVRKMLLIDPIGPMKQYSTRLDKEMNDILHDSKLLEDAKLQRYLLVLRRYILSKRTAAENPTNEKNMPYPSSEKMKIDKAEELAVDIPKMSSVSIEGKYPFSSQEEFVTTKEIAPSS